MPTNPFAARWSRTVALVIDHARPIRVPLLVVALGCVATLGADQVAELFLMTAWSRASWWWYLWVLAMSLGAGLAVWYTARNAYRLRYRRWPACSMPEAKRLRAILPRVLGVAVPLLIALGTVISWFRIGVARDGLDQLRFWTSVAGFVGVALLLLAIVRRRDRLATWGRDQKAHNELDSAGQYQVQRVRDLGPGPLRVFAVTLGINVLFTVLIAWFPHLLNGVGPLSIVLLAGTFLCVSGGFLTLIADRHGFPLLTTLAAIAVLWQALAWNDNHAVRLAPDARSAAKDQPLSPVPLTFAAYRDAWIARACTGRDPCPVVLVAAEGGGIRAAAWTALVLAELDRRSNGALAPRVFAGSGVSGGSLGLATWVALRRSQREATPERIATIAHDFLAEDFLSATLANLFFVDFTQRLLPFPLFDDRGRALTLSWESAWRRHAGDRRFAQPLAALYRDAGGAPDASLPALFLNSTAVGSGARVVQHPFAALPTIRDRPWAQAIDGATLMPATLPLSEAVLNSARFSWVSPAGTVTPDGDPLRRVQLVDGGYFENSGATTLRDVIEALREYRGGHRLVLRVLHLSNDPSLPGFASSIDRDLDPGDRCPPDPHPVPVRGDASAPLHALLNTRNARGAYAREMLDRSLAPGDRLWHLRLCRGQYPIPLGWVISESVFVEMQRQLEAQPLDRIAEALLAP